MTKKWNSYQIIISSISLQNGLNKKSYFQMKKGEKKVKICISIYWSVMFMLIFLKTHLCHLLKTALGINMRFSIEKMQCHETEFSAKRFKEHSEYIRKSIVNIPNMSTIDSLQNFKKIEKSTKDNTSSKREHFNLVGRNYLLNLIKYLIEQKYLIKRSFLI